MAGRKPKYQVKLNDEQREQLLGMQRRGIHSARSLERARILLYSDEGQSNKRIAELLHSSEKRVTQVQKRFVEGGLQRALEEAPRGGRPVEWTGRDEALLTTIACSEPPEGRTRWTLRLLKERFVELSDHESLSHEQIRLMLKKTTSSRGKRSSGSSRKRT